MTVLIVQVAGMRCRHAVREISARLRDVPGVQTVTADPGTGTLVLTGAMNDVDVLEAVAGSPYAPVFVEAATVLPTP